MFRRRSTNLPKDPVFPQNLKELGYFINENDQIVMIGHPDKKYVYKIHTRIRVNDLGRDAYNTCVRNIVLDRLHQLGLETIRLPAGAAENEPHVPILASPNLSNAKRVLVFFGERHQDLGIYAYRLVGGDAGITVGSVIEMVKTVKSGNLDTLSLSYSSSFKGHKMEAPSWESNPTAIVITNPGQLIWCRSEGRAMGRLEWESRPRESAVHESCQTNDEKNLIERNRNEDEHVGYVFDHVLKQAGAGQAKLEIIGGEWAGASAVTFLAKNWATWAPRMNALALFGPIHNTDDILVPSDYAGNSFAHFMATRARGYVLSDVPIGILSSTKSHQRDYGCSIYTSGEPLYEECIMPRAWRHILAWFERLDTRGATAEEDWRLPEGEDKESDEDGEWGPAPEKVAAEASGTEGVSLQ